jgi:hypothetical protein
MRRATRLLPVALVGLILLSASGCSYVYTFDLAITVVNATDDKPIHGAHVTLQFYHSPRGGGGTNLVTLLTDTTGKMSRWFYVSTSEFDGYGIRRPWEIRVACDGYVPQLLNIKPTTKPDHKTTTPLKVTVRLEPVSP